MFVSHDISSNKKKFQKPNILRKKTNINKASIVSKTNKAEFIETSDVNSLLTSSFILDQKHNDLEVDKCKSNKNIQIVNKSASRFKVDNENETNLLSNVQNTTPNVAKNNMLYLNNCQSFEENQNVSLNVESFLLCDDARQNVAIFDNDLLNKELDEEGKQKWCIDFSQETQKLVIEQYDSCQLGSLYLEQKSDVSATMVPLAAVSSIHKNNCVPSDALNSMVTVNLGSNNSAIEENNYKTMTITALPTISHTDTIQANYPSMSTIDALNGAVSEDSSIEQGEDFTSMDAIKELSIEELSQRPVKFKCEAPDCNKEFMSEQKLKKHVTTHNKNTTPKVPRQTTVECPVKKILESGMEEPCGKIFHVRVDLIKHLNEDHTIEEAVYRCTECSRRFFWASGLRAHARAHAGREREGRLLACPWPGCARAFRQPCRLREHARSHTGDKPYSCRHPNCGWSFRTASKLLRHARRHTGDRRHACAACGRAFLRREHLRDHAARHHAHARRLHACPRADCQHTFTNMSTLYMHMKKVHKKEESNPPAIIATTEDQQTAKDASENLFMVSLLEPSPLEEACEESGGGGGGGGGGEEGQAARTHCTWPLASRAARFRHADAYVLEEDVQVEQSESSESNIYTVKSDLFLHGNVLHNEDSEQMGRCVRAAEAEGALALDTDLLLDAPSVHLDQEELYADPVDESAFRVFLLSGEELT